MLRGDLVVSVSDSRLTNDLFFLCGVHGRNEDCIAFVQIFSVWIISVDLVSVGTLGPYNSDDLNSVVVFKVIVIVLYVVNIGKNDLGLSKRVVYIFVAYFIVENDHFSFVGVGIYLVVIL